MLRKLRKINKLTQKQLADILCAEQSYISRLERFLKKPSLNFLERVSKEFNICIVILISDYYCTNCKIKCINKHKVTHFFPMFGTTRYARDYNNIGDKMVISKRNTRIKITITKELHSLLKDEAEYEGRSVSNMAAKILTDYYRQKSNKLRE